MSLKSMMTSFTLLLTAVVTGCQGHQYTPFVARDESKTTDLAQRVVIEQKRVKKYVSEKKPLFVELGFDDEEQSDVDEHRLIRFPAQNRKLRTRKRNRTEDPPTATVQIKPEAAAVQREASLNRLVGHTNEEPIRLVNLAEASPPPAPSSESAISSGSEMGTTKTLSIDDQSPFGLQSYPIDLPATLRLAGADGCRLAWFFQDFDNDAIQGGGYIEGGFVGFELNDFTILSDPFSFFCVPRSDLNFGNGFPHRGDFNFNRHRAQFSNRVIL